MKGCASIDVLEFWKDWNSKKKKKKKECGVGNKPSSLFIDNISVKKYI